MMPPCACNIPHSPTNQEIELLQKKALINLKINFAFVSLLSQFYTCLHCQRYLEILYLSMPVVENHICSNLKRVHTKVICNFNSVMLFSKTEHYLIEAYIVNDSLVIYVLCSNSWLCVAICGSS